MSITIGVVLVACCAATTDGVLCATMTSASELDEFLRDGESLLRLVRGATALNDDVPASDVAEGRHGLGEWTGRVGESGAGGKEAQEPDGIDPPWLLSRSGQCCDEKP